MDFKKTASDTVAILKKTISYIGQDQPIVYSAAIAFFTIFSLPAILVVIVLIGMIFFEREEIKDEITAQVERNVDAEAAEQIREVMENVLNLPENFIYIALAIIVIIKSATMIFGILQKALNSIWKVKLKKGVGFWKIAKYRTIPLLFVIGLGFLLVFTLFVDLIQSYITNVAEGILPEALESFVFSLSKFIFNFSIVFLFFTIIHKTLPDAIIQWKDAIAGGIVTTVLFLIGTRVINLIISNLDLDNYYSAAGSLVIILLWIFYSSVILFLCGEITKAYAIQRGHKIQPKPIAVRYSMTINEENE
ncbi:putative ribonuclease [Indibacter alkaliphilus LW1]|uniref:Ribonuclease n=1 Tax=Indibacter alkaliphilus (strain CCUG 57479 / KCTC 22604 / LW1) TaxID=1189612 RepID=S2DKS9_INDAL|nr:YihY/virulence factor BrkB family protein [Indibacter alkaliphilus]EOZ99704.1 putative ribonuclease [Indibacter alkaliphilus LW1]